MITRILSQKIQNGSTLFFLAHFPFLPGRSHLSLLSFLHRTHLLFLFLSATESFLLSEKPSLPDLFLSQSSPLSPQHPSTLRNSPSPSLSLSIGLLPPTLPDRIRNWPPRGKSNTTPHTPPSSLSRWFVCRCSNPSTTTWVVVAPEPTTIGRIRDFY
jgi:hypothetical protein